MTQTCILPDGTTEDALIDEIGNRQLVGKLLARLKPREEFVIRLRFGLGAATAMTLEQVGERIGVCRDRVRQIEGRAIRDMRTTFKRLGRRTKRYDDVTLAGDLQSAMTASAAKTALRAIEEKRAAEEMRALAIETAKLRRIRFDELRQLVPLVYGSDVSVTLTAAELIGEKMLSGQSNYDEAVTAALATLRTLSRMIAQQEAA